MSNIAALGLNISSDQISLALVRKAGKNLQLVRSASAPMPENIIAGGNIKNPVLLAKTIKELCSKNKVSTANVFISLLVKPSLMRIMDMPREVGGNVNQFITDELKHYAPFSGKTIGHDFSAIKSSKSNRILLGAYDEDKVASLVQACNRINVIIRGIEPSAIGVVRALYAKHVAKKFGTNVVIAHLHDGNVTFCVFKDGVLDFLKQSVIAGKLNNEESIAAFVEECVSVRQYYDLELGETGKKWEFFVAGSAASTDQALVKQTLQDHLRDDLINICSDQSLADDLPVVVAQQVAVDIAAVGLAMKPLVTSSAELKLNLLPAKTDDAHNLQKFGIITANVAAAVFLAMLLLVPVVKGKIKTVQDATAKQLKVNNLVPMQELLSEQNHYVSQSKYLTERIAVLKSLEVTTPNKNYAVILRELQLKTPRAVQITKLITKEDNTATIQGLASSSEAIHVFVNFLNRSPLIASASLLRTELDPAGNGFISYNISIVLDLKESDPNAR